MARRAMVAALLVAPVPALAVPEAAGKGAAADPLRGQLLVAVPQMPDPRFARTVILIADHDSGGAFGIAVNRPIGTRSIAELLRAMDEDPAGAQGSLTLFAGGPVEPTVGLVLHTGDYRTDHTTVVTKELSISSPRPVLRDTAAGRGPRKLLLAVGYSGWAAGQLEAEIARGGWALAVPTEALVFDMDRAQVWDAAYARRVESL
ncbi:MAG: YqgE/AlgH family protein [Proteobacteria bacterium]|nr:YqgE/AlgH family protein [Pseudomonadota bacterium]